MRFWEPPPAALGKIKSPAGDCITLTSYREYVCRILAEELTMEELAELRAYFECPLEELVDKIVEHKMIGIPRRRH